MALEIPPIGLGVYKAGDAVYDAVRYALEIGYRHVDCAKIYGNEALVGQAIRDSGIPREEIYVTTKLWPGRPGPAPLPGLGVCGRDAAPLARGGCGAALSGI